MRQAFDNIVKKLKQDELCLIAVSDDDTYTKLMAATSGKAIISQNGSIENYFDTLVKKGHTKIAIQEYRKSGSGTKKMGEALHFNLSPIENKVVDSIVSPHNAPANPLGLAGNMGLGWADIMAMNTDSVLKQRLEVENGFLKSENETLKEKVAELKEAHLENKYNSDSKAGQIDLIGKLLTAAPMLLGSFTKAPAGLNSPASNQPQLSEIKNQLVQVISDANFSDDMAGVLFSVLHKINSEETFWNELETLLQPKN